MGCIYLITNIVNKKQYVGYTSFDNVLKRFEEHWRSRKSQKNGKSYLHAAMAKYGKENFSIKQIDITSEDDWIEKEQFWIQYYNTLVPNGYNICIGGEKPPVHYGDNNCKTKIKDAEIINIYNDLLEYKLTIREIADKYHASTDEISRINKGTARRIEGYHFPLRKMKKQLWDVYHIIEDMKDGMSQTELEIKYCIKNRTKLYDISRGKIGRKTNPQPHYPIRNDIINRIPLYLINN